MNISGKVAIERIPSGVPGMDQIIDGGIPKKTSLLLYGDNGSGKASMCIQFTKSGLETGEQVLYISTQLPLWDLRAKMGQLGLDAKWYEREGNLVLVNPLTMEVTGLEMDEQMRATRFLDVEHNIASIAGQINQAKRMLLKDQIRIVLDSLTGLSVNTSEDALPELFNLIQTMTRRVRLQNHVALFTVGPATDMKTIERLKVMMDGFIQFKVDLDRDIPERKMIIHNLLFTGKAIGRYNYIFTPNGIEVNRY